jgi:hypothetical protein
MTFDNQKLFSLLPALYRLRDARLAQSQNGFTAADAAQLQALQTLQATLNPSQQQQLRQLTAKSYGPLQALLALVAEQLAAVEDDLDQLYDNQFIETCAPWVIPYIGDLIGYQAVKGVAAAVANPRAEVANTISFRRRKGTVLVLEQLARDATGWGAHAVEFFKLLAATQYINHVRLGNYYAPDLRHWEPREFMDTGFDRTAHKIDIRRIAVQRGRYNIQDIGIFLWSLNAYSLTMSPASPTAGNTQCFRFSPLGTDLPLFNHPLSQGSDITAPAQPVNVPDRLRRRVLCRDIKSGAGAVYYGAGKSVALYVGGQLLKPNEIQICDLGGEDGHWANLPVTDDYTAAIDPKLGRIALSPATANASPPPQVAASFYYGFNGDMGGGEYPRSDSFTSSPEQKVIQVSGNNPDLQSALNRLAGDGVVEITDSDSYYLPEGLRIEVNAHGHIEFRAADGCRPTLILGDNILVTGGSGGALDLNGFLVAYSPNSSPVALPHALVHAPDSGTNQLSHLGFTHCTLVPGWALTPGGDPQYAHQPGLVAEPSGLQVVVQKSILGGARTAPLVTASFADSIVDATASTGVAYSTLDGLGGGALTLTGCTVIGQVHATLLPLISNSIVWAELSAADFQSSPPGPRTAPLLADRKQEGCVRFSYLPAGSVIPRHFECVEQAPGSPEPIFVSLRYGDPGYAKLFPSTDPTLRQGADDGGEMGAFHFLLAPLRETDLRVRMNEYLPVGLEFGIFYQT